MVWKEIAPRGELISWDTPKVITGIYRGAEERTTKLGANVVHSIELDGRTYNFFGTTLLNQALEGIQDGTLIKVEYTGQTIKTGSGFRMKEFKVYVDSDSPDTGTQPRNS